MENVIIFILAAAIMMTLFLRRFFNMLKSKKEVKFNPLQFKRSDYYFGSKDEEAAILEKRDIEKKKIIREALLKRGYTSEEIKEIEEKNQELVNDLIEKISKSEKN